MEEDDQEKRLNFDKYGFAKLPGGGVACSTAQAARLLDLTVQRVNQLANEGIAVKVGRGLVNFPATLNRYAAYLADQKRGSAAAPRSSLYWDMKTREIDLRTGATNGEMAELRRVFEALLKLLRAQGKAMSELSGHEKKIAPLQREITESLYVLVKLFDKVDENAIAHLNMIREFNSRGTL